MFLARAYTGLGDRLQARAHLTSYEKSDLSTTYAGRTQAATEWLAVGEYDRALASFDEQEQHMQGDTLCDNYAVILRGRAKIAEHQGRLAAALDYRRRYEVIVDSLNTRLLESKANDYAARYQLQEHRLETEQLKARTAHNQLINIAIGIAFVLALAALGWYWRQQRVICRKNRSLVQQISETIKYKKMYEEMELQTPPLEGGERSTEGRGDGSSTFSRHPVSQPAL